MSIAGVTRELLVRYLETWAPGAVHGARRATFALALGGASAEATGLSGAGATLAGQDLAEAALLVFAESADRLRGRRLTFVVTSPAPDGLAQRLDAVQRELRTPAELAVHVVEGDGCERLPVALAAAGAAGAPLLAYVTADGLTKAAPVVRAAAAGRPAEVLVVLPVGDPDAATAAGAGWTECRTILRTAGFALSAGVELVGDIADEAADCWLVGFATSSAKSLEAFKNALWAVDEFAGVRYRDPHDPEGHLLDITLSPHPGPLRRELLAYLATTGSCEVTQLRRYTMTDTVYRAADATGALTALLNAGLVHRHPERGRLGGDVMITLAGPGASTAPITD